MVLSRQIGVWYVLSTEALFPIVWLCKQVSMYSAKALSYSFVEGTILETDGFELLDSLCVLFGLLGYGYFLRSKLSIAFHYGTVRYISSFHWHLL
ncbi:MAG: hypothetical protein [Cressdnaviricota sp.]|nr:MAG: hypothetical protein [Cressdnaviricota sp.]